MSDCSPFQTRFLLAILVCGLACAAYPLSLWAETYALVIGVNDCPDFRLAGGIKPRPLRGAETDAQAMSDLLADQFRVPGDHLQLLVGNKATLAAVRQAWKALDQKLVKADQVILYFAGHGTQVKDQPPLDEEDDRLDEALCLTDTTADGKNLLLDDELARWLEETAAGKVTVILDCCHAGSGTKDADDDLAPRYLPIMPAGVSIEQPSAPWRDLSSSTKSLDKQITAFFACKPNQQAYERRLTGQRAHRRSGQFTHYLLEGLKDNPHASGKELLAFVRKKLDQSFNQDRTQPAERQEPALDGSPRLPLFINGEK